MITPNTTLKEMIHIEREAIPANICDDIVQYNEKKIWEQHHWNVAGDYDSTYTNDEKELDVFWPEEKEQQLLYPIIQKACISYADLHADSYPIVTNLSAIRYNRYDSAEQQIMRSHVDHISSIFDGNERGIPVLSIIGNLNDDYEGAKLTFWNDYSLNLGKGDLVIWPSLFLYPHHVTEATKNKRYSLVCWAY